MYLFLRLIIGGALVVAIAAGSWWSYQKWQADQQQESAQQAPAAAGPVIPGTVPVKLSRQARDNLGLVSKPIQSTIFWRTIDLPGVIVDRPGVSDRGVVSPVSGVVTKINAFPGDTVAPGDPLFTIRLVSESLHASQMELFKATQNIEIAQQQYTRLAEAAQSGALPQSRIIEIENELKRLNVTVQAYTQDLQARGLPAEGIASAARGDFVTEIVVHALQERVRGSNNSPETFDFTLEIHSLKVELGAQVEAGQLLCNLADHRRLFVEGRAFKDDLPLVQTAAKEGWPVQVDFGAERGNEWGEPPSHLPIHHVANTIDPETRTFAFYLSLNNESQSYATPEGATRRLWRFRPGGRVALRVPVEELDDVFVLPREAVVQEGPEAYIFRQNGDLFDRRPVRVLLEDRLYAVLANDGSIIPGVYVAHNNAASLNRVLKAQSASGMPANVHVHADGTVHGAH